MNAQHTPEPWTTGEKVNGDTCAVFSLAYDTAHPEQICRASTPGNARRIAACVTAFENYPLEIIESFTQKAPIEPAAVLAALRAQNAELRDALKVIMQGFESGDFQRRRPRQSDTDPYHPALVRASAALAQAEEEMK